MRLSVCPANRPSTTGQASCELGRCEDEKRAHESLRQRARQPPAPAAATERRRRRRSEERRTGNYYYYYCRALVRWSAPPAAAFARSLARSGRATVQTPQQWPPRPATDAADQIWLCLLRARPPTDRRAVVCLPPPVSCLRAAPSTRPFIAVRSLVRVRRSLPDYWRLLLLLAFVQVGNGPKTNAFTWPESREEPRARRPTKKQKAKNLHRVSQRRARTRVFAWAQNKQPANKSQVSKNFGQKCESESKSESRPELAAGRARTLRSRSPIWSSTSCCCCPTCSRANERTDGRATGS